MTPEKALEAAIAKIGTKADFARLLGITPQAVGKWRIVPPDKVLLVEAKTGIPRHSLRPDYYPKENKRHGK